MGHGSIWIRKTFNFEMSNLGEDVADFLDFLATGIYHIDNNSLKRVDWTNTDYIAVTLSTPRDIATFDFDWLTRIVVLSHDRCLRVSMEPSSPKTFKLLFHKRERNADALWKRMPTLEDHVKGLRDGWK